MKFSKESFISFRDYLAVLYKKENSSRRILDEIGLDASEIEFSSSAKMNWHEILKYAEPRGQLDSIFNYALGENPTNEVLLNIKNQTPVVEIEGGKIKNWKGDDAEFTPEKIIGAADKFIDVNYLEKGMICSKAVVRVKFTNSAGSGFLIEGNTLVTNHHVIPDKDAAALATIQFNHQKTIRGIDAIPDDYSLEVESFKTSKLHDWTIVKVAGNPEATWGALTLGPVTPKKGTYVNIIQHPAAGQKKLTHSANVVVFCDDDIVHYLTDTEEGSSGAPVFDKEWNVIALHQGGGDVSEPGDQTENTYFRNQGININRVIEGVNS